MADRKPADFEELYRAHYLPIFLYVRKRIGNLHDAEELVSEIFETACRYYPSYDPAKSAVGTWLYVIAGSRLKNFYRKNRPACLDIDGLADLLPCAETGFESVEAAGQLQQLRDLLADALEKLSERSRRAVVMKYFLGFTAEDIAANLGTSAGNVRVILLRALRQMERTIPSSSVNWEEFTHG